MVVVDPPNNSAEVILSEPQADALRVVRSVWPDAAVILIGATALAQHISVDYRKTYDLDLAVAVSVENFGDELAALPGWTRDAMLEHQFVSPTGQRLDVLPASNELIDQGYIEWPSGTRMSLVGFDLAFANSTTRPVRVQESQSVEGLTLDVPAAPVIALLKMRAWLDRPHERAKDLEDLAQLCAHYIADDNERRWIPEVTAQGESLTYEQMSPFLLGLDLAAMVTNAHRTHVERFLAKVLPEQLHRPSSRFGDEGDTTVYEAFVRGFGAL